MRADISPADAARALRYLVSLDSIEGWLSADTAFAMMALAWEQAPKGVSLGMAEIGVHHGKSFMALAAGARPGEPITAIDVFERQDLNVDRSGAGNRDMFLSNVRRFFPAVRPHLIAASSESVRGVEKGHGLTNLRMFSIDGGHTSALTLNDLQIADTALGENGICVLDDVLNRRWTGVITGLFRYFSKDGDLVPFALVPNKLLLCRPAWRSQYKEFMQSRFGYALDKGNVKFADQLIDVYQSIWSPSDGLAGGLVYLSEIAAKASNLANRIAALEADLAQERLHTAALLSSTSWRTTAPLRAIAKVFTGLVK